MSSAAQVTLPTDPQIHPSDLKIKALRGGSFIVVRQGLGMLLSLGSLLFVTRIIGPLQYGIFASAFAIVFFLTRLGTWGIDAYLIRKTANPNHHEYSQAFTLTLAIGSSFFISTILLRNVIANVIKIPPVAPVLLVLAFYIPLTLLSLAGIVQLSRELNFKKIASIELLSQLLFCIVSIPLAYKGAGVWAPSLGTVLQAACTLVLTYRLTPLRPGVTWNPVLVRDTLAYGLSYSSSTWVWQLRTIVNPVIVGRFAGVEAVGFVALAIRAVELLSYARVATARVAMAALAKIKEDRSRLRRSIEEGMRLQAIAVGFPLAMFGLFAPLFMPKLFGDRWAPFVQIFPFVAIGYLCNSMFNLHASVLYLFRKNVSVIVFNAVHVAIFLAAAGVLVSWMGYIGYGWSEIAALGSYLVIHKQVAKVVTTPQYSTAFLWFATSCTAILLSGFPALRLLAPAVLLLPLLKSKERESVGAYAKLLFCGQSV